MTKQIKKFTGIFGDQVEPFGQLFLHHEPLQKRSSFYNYEITEHLHTNLVQIFLITSGEGILLSVEKKIPLISPCVLVIPNHVLHGFVFSSAVKGDVFTLSNEKFDQFLKDFPAQFSVFESLQYISFDSGSDLLMELMDLKLKMLKEYQLLDHASEFNLSLLFQMFLVNLCRSKTKRKLEIIDTDDKTLKHFYTYRKLIQQHIHQHKSVQFYASTMSMSTVHLNRICKTVVQKTALQVIHEYVIQEAKKYLKGTSHNIAEIAFILEFKDPAHFSKFFKKMVGMTPRQFRQ